MRSPNRRHRSRCLNIETLEDRRVLATWGIAWPDAQHLTASFVPDGTSDQGESNVLSQTLNSQLGAGNWQTTILKALQTWAVNSNINIGLVADGGEPIGVTGPAQGDSRFGDIRISAEPLASDVVAITAGDIILNSNDSFAPGTAGSYDLYTVVLHEAGHVFGFADSSDPTSFMDNVYQGPVTGLASGAVPALQAMYGGARNINAIDGNNVSTSASSPVAIASPSATTPVTISADLPTSQSTDYLSIAAPTLLTSLLGENLNIQTSGLSLLTPKVTVYDPYGNVVTSATASSPLSGGVSVHIPSTLFGQNDTVRVTGATGDVFSVGSYDLTLSQTQLLWSPSNPVVGSTAVSEPSNYNGATPLTVGTTITQNSQTDAYSFRAPSSLTSVLTFNVQDWGIGLLAPSFTVYNFLGIAVGTATASSTSVTSVSLTIGSILPNQTYYVSVQNGRINQDAFGSYQLSLAFTASSATSTNFAPATPWFGSNIPWNGQTNTTFATAATLQNSTGEAPAARYLAIEGITSTQNQQYYKLTTPSVAAGQTEVLTVSTESLGNGSLLPWVLAFDQNGNSLNAQVLAEQGGSSVIQVTVPNPGSVVYLEVASDPAPGTASTGNFYLEATFGNVMAADGPIASGALPSVPAGSVASTSTSLSVSQTEVYTYVLAGSPSNTTPGTLLFAYFINSSGVIVSSVETSAQTAESGVAILPAGDYTILIQAENFDGLTLPSLTYSLTGEAMTDPIKVYATSGAVGTTSGS
jgi:hypothetical protein